MEVDVVKIVYIAPQSVQIKHNKHGHVKGAVGHLEKC